MNIFFLISFHEPFCFIIRTTGQPIHLDILPARPLLRRVEETGSYFTLIRDPRLCGVLLHPHRACGEMEATSAMWLFSYTVKTNTHFGFKNVPIFRYYRSNLEQIYPYQASGLPKIQTFGLFWSGPNWYRLWGTAEIGSKTWPISTRSRFFTQDGYWPKMGTYL